MVFSRFN